MMKNTIVPSINLNGFQDQKQDNTSNLSTSIYENSKISSGVSSAENMLPYTVICHKHPELKQIIEAWPELSNSTINAIFALLAVENS